MRYLPILVCIAALVAGLDAAHAHPGHVADGGHGHSHWLALIILGGLGSLAAGVVLFRFFTGRLPFIDARRAGQ